MSIPLPGTARGHRASPEFALPQFPNFASALRTLTGDDTDITAIPDGEKIDIKSSRFGGLNYVVLDVVGAAAGVTVALYRQEKNPSGSGSIFVFQSRQTTTEAIQTLTWRELLNGVYVVFVTGVGAGAVINGGGTV